jgi:glycosyltransferase involved in cell wall biosynthesis
VVSICRLDAGKGLDLAVEAAEILRAQGMRFHWKILGDGPMRSVLEQEIRSRGLVDCIELCGFQLDVAGHIESADVFVLPSVSEGRSTAVDEAIAMGVTVVVTAYRTAASQVDHGITGLIVEMDAESLADGIGSVLAPAVRDAMRASRPEEKSDGSSAADLLTRLSGAR